MDNIVIGTPTRGHMKNLNSTQARGNIHDGFGHRDITESMVFLAGHACCVLWYFGPSPEGGRKARGNT